jgi:hypothetical protein
MGVWQEMSGSEAVPSERHVRADRPPPDRAKGRVVHILRRPIGAVRRARVAILTFAAVYALSVLLGIAMVTAGDPFALGRRDDIVAGARSDASLTADRAGDHLQAAVLDFAENLVLGAIPSTLTGISIVGSYPFAAYRGWIGGIVSVDRDHRSRLADPARALYYIVTLVPQLIPYSIAGGMGVYLGVGVWRELLRHPGSWSPPLPRDRITDTALAYAIIAPLFLVASLWEFLAPR